MKKIINGLFIYLLFSCSTKKVPESSREVSNVKSASILAIANEHSIYESAVNKQFIDLQNWLDSINQDLKKQSIVQTNSLKYSELLSNSQKKWKQHVQCECNLLGHQLRNSNVNSAFINKCLSDFNKKRIDKLKQLKQELIEESIDWYLEGEINITETKDDNILPVLTSKLAGNAIRYSSEEQKNMGYWCSESIQNQLRSSELSGIIRKS